MDWTVKKFSRVINANAKHTRYCLRDGRLSYDPIVEAKFTERAETMEWVKMWIDNIRKQEKKNCSEIPDSCKI